MGNNHILPRNSDGFEKNKNLKHPGDEITQKITNSGDVITKIDTKEKKATHRQYMKKNGEPGKQTITIMQPDKSK